MAQLEKNVSTQTSANVSTSLRAVLPPPRDASLTKEPMPALPRQAPGASYASDEAGSTHSNAGSKQLPLKAIEPLREFDNKGDTEKQLREYANRRSTVYRLESPADQEKEFKKIETEQRKILDVFVKDNKQISAGMQAKFIAPSLKKDALQLLDPKSFDGSPREAADLLRDANETKNPELIKATKEWLKANSDQISDKGLGKLKRADIAAFIP